MPVNSEVRQQSIIPAVVQNLMYDANDRGQLIFCTVICSCPGMNGIKLLLNFCVDNWTCDEPLVSSTAYGTLSLRSPDNEAEPYKPIRSLVATVKVLLSLNVICNNRQIHLLKTVTRRHYAIRRIWPQINGKSCRIVNER